MSNQTGVWSGVKIGCGMFIVLPAILIVVFMAIAVPTCGAINKQRETIEKVKQEAREKAQQNKQ